MSQETVVRVSRCELSRSKDTWQYAEHNREDISAHWKKRHAENPAFFNGRLFVMEPPTIADKVLTASFVETDFASMLWWKETGYPDDSMYDGFGSAMIRASGGEVLLARQRPGNVNAGKLYMPGGFIDLRDITSDGQIDIEASIARELEEETGLPASEFDRNPGFIITRSGPLVSMAIEYRSNKPANALRDTLMANLARQDDPELSEFVIFDAPPDAKQDTDVIPFARRAVEAVMGGL